MTEYILAQMHMDFLKAMCIEKTKYNLKCEFMEPYLLVLTRYHVMNNKCYYYLSGLTSL